MAVSGISSKTYEATMDLETSQILKDLICWDFTRCVVPENVLGLFRLPANKSLSVQDMAAIEDKVRTADEIAASGLLLDRLKNYPNWFTILLQVLTHPEINQEHLASRFEECLEKASEMTLNGTIAGPHNDVNNSTYMRNQPLANNGTEYDEPDSVKRGAASSTGGPVNQTPSQRQRKDAKREPISEFSFAETEMGLSVFKGWQMKRSDKQVIPEFKDILDQNKDGHYMVWYWEKEKRPAISVSHNGKIITFVILRRCDETSPTGFMHYIVDKIVSTSTLSELFLYHKEKGLPNLKEGPDSENIRMRYPMSH